MDTFQLCLPGLILSFTGSDFNPLLRHLGVGTGEPLFSMGCRARDSPSDSTRGPRGDLSPFSLPFHGAPARLVARGCHREPSLPDGAHGDETRRAFLWRCHTQAAAHVLHPQRPWGPQEGPMAGDLPRGEPVSMGPRSQFIPVSVCPRGENVSVFVGPGACARLLRPSSTIRRNASGTQGSKKKKPK